MQSECRTHHELLQRTLAGDRDAGERLAAALRTEATRVARAVLPSPDDVEDIVQEALYRALARLGQLQEAAALLGWMRAITLNECRQHLRSGRAEQLLLLPEPDERATASLPAPEPGDLWLRDLVLGSIAQLPPGQRLVVAGHYLAGHSQPQVARELQLPLITVKSRLQKARRNLRKEMLKMATAAPSATLRASLDADALAALRRARRFVASDAHLQYLTCGSDEAAAAARLASLSPLRNIWVGRHGVLAVDTMRYFCFRGEQFAPLADQALPPTVGDWLADTAPGAEQAVLTIRDGRGELTVSPTCSFEFATVPAALERLTRLPLDFPERAQPQPAHLVRVPAALLLETLLRCDAFLSAAPPSQPRPLPWDQARLALSLWPGGDCLQLQPDPASVPPQMGPQVRLAARVTSTDAAEPLTIWLNRHFLAECIAAVALPGAEVALGFTGPLSVVTFREPGRPTPVALLMPMTVSN